MPSAESRPTVSRRALLRGVLGASVLGVSGMALSGCSEGHGKARGASEGQAGPAFDTSKIDAAIGDLITAGAPGVLLNVRAGKQTYATGSGVSSYVTNQRARPDQPVRVASITKSMLTSRLLMLVADGALELDAPIDQYLPGVVAAPTPPTVRQFLGHQTGMPDYITLYPHQTLTEVDDIIEKHHTLDEIIGVANGAKWMFNPGQKFYYSNSNYIVLSKLLETLTGRTVSEELADRVFTPAGLHDTTLPEDRTAPRTMMHGYVTISGIYSDTTEQDASIWSGAGGVISTVADVNSFYRSLFQGSIIDAPQLTDMMTISKGDYGLGLMRSHQKNPKTGAMVPLYGHIGSGFGYRMMSFSTDDGDKQVTFSWTASEATYNDDPRMKAAKALLAASFGAIANE